MARAVAVAIVMLRREGANMRYATPRPVECETRREERRRGVLNTHPPHTLPPYRLRGGAYGRYLPRARAHTRESTRRVDISIVSSFLLRGFCMVPT